MERNLVVKYETPSELVLRLTKEGLEKMNNNNDGELNWLLDELSDDDIILGNEINEGFTHYFIDNDRQVFEFDENDMVTLKESSFGDTDDGALVLISIGTIEDIADMDNPNHIEFIDWFNGTSID